MKEKDLYKNAKILTQATLLDLSNLIQITTIKKKFLSQIQELISSEWKDVSNIIGMVEGFKIIVLMKDNSLRSIHRIDWIGARSDVLIEEGHDWKEANEIAQKEISCLRQLFLD